MSTIDDLPVDFTGKNLPPAPAIIEGDVVDLLFISIRPGEEEYGFVPYYHFSVCLHEQQENIGHINFKVGTTPHVLLCAGHIGYGILPPFRGHSYARYACLTLVPFVRARYDSVILTTDPDNIASIKTIENLGAVHLGLHPIPPDDPNYAKGIRLRHRYEWHVDRVK